MSTMLLELAALSLLARQEQRDLGPHYWAMLPRVVRCALTGPLWLNDGEMDLLIGGALAWTLEGVAEADILAELRRVLWERADTVSPYDQYSPWNRPQNRAHARRLIALLEPNACAHDDEHPLDRRRIELRRALEHLGLLVPQVIVLREAQPI